MKRYVLSVIFLLSCSWCQGFHLDNVAVCPRPLKTTASVKRFFAVAPSSLREEATIVTDPTSLLQVATDALRYLQAHCDGHDQTINPQKFRFLLSYEAVERTLKFIIATIKEDKKTGHNRIQDSDFLRANFGSISWRADHGDAARQAVEMPSDGRIRLTTYGILALQGSHHKTAEYPCALYQIFDLSIQNKYTKQQILSGALEKKLNHHKRRVLAWVSRQDMEDALMHGTVIVNFHEGGTKILNVDVHNGISYDRKQKNMLAQKRYWFFRELKNQHPSHMTLVERFKKRQGVIFAGDVYNIGFGKFIALSYAHPITGKQEMRLGILADTGGAFINNLYQLDMFGGVFADRQEMKKYRADVPLFARATILFCHPGQGPGSQKCAQRAHR
ncbi:MAG: hypothetical protein WCW33_06475 [Candidatus Babeliales bacterium]|jgi:hypothetical protein